jgi:hypothetical protein
MEKCSPSLAIMEKQIKSTLRFHLTPVRIASIRNTTCDEDVGEKEHSYTAVGMEASTTTLENNMEAS